MAPQSALRSPNNFMFQSSICSIPESFHYTDVQERLYEDMSIFSAVLTVTARETGFEP